MRVLARLHVEHRATWRTILVRASTKPFVSSCGIRSHRIAQSVGGLERSEALSIGWIDYTKLKYTCICN